MDPRITLHITATSGSWLNMELFFGSRGLATWRPNRVGVEEQGEPVWICTQLRESWPAIWSQALFLG